MDNSTLTAAIAGAKTSILEGLKRLGVTLTDDLREYAAKIAAGAAKAGQAQSPAEREELFDNALIQARLLGEAQRLAGVHLMWDTIEHLGQIAGRTAMLIVTAALGKLPGV